MNTQGVPGTMLSAISKISQFLREESREKNGSGKGNIKP